MTILAVTGLKREAEIVGVEDVVSIAGGGDAGSLMRRINSLHGDIKGVISIGLGGALSPLLRVGDVVIADQIIAQNKSWPCHAGWRVKLAARLGQAHQGSIAASPQIVATVLEKAELFERTGALAVDLESEVAARFAAARAIPLAGLRVISDDAQHGLPPAALVAMQAQGTISIRKILVSLLTKPLQFGQLIRTARDSKKAFAALLGCLDLCGRGIAGTDL